MATNGSVVDKLVQPAGIEVRWPRGNTRGPHPSCGGIERGQILPGTADDADELPENVPAHRYDAV